MMHRGCGRPVRTLRTFSYDRAAPLAPVSYFLCAKEMTPIMCGLLFDGAPLLIRIALSALDDASCDCACYDQASCIEAAARPVRTLRTFSYDRAAPSAPVLYFLCAKQMTPIMWGLLLVLLLLIRSALSALDASCDCACYDQA